MKIFVELLKSINKSDQNFFIFLIFLSIISMFFEVLSISLIIPILGALTDNTQTLFPEFILNYLNLNYDNINTDIIFKTALIILLIVFFIKTIFQFFYVWIQNYYIQSLRLFFSNRLMKKYINQPWIFFLNRNSSELIRNVHSEAPIISATLNNYIQVCTEVILILGFFILLLITTLIPTLVVGSIILLNAVIFLIFFKNKNKNWGFIRQKLVGRVINHVQQMVGAIRDIKIFKKEIFYLEKFKIDNEAAAKISVKVNILFASPKIIFELVAITIFVFGCLALFNIGYSVSEILMTIGIFGAVSLRLMPSIIRLIAFLQKIRNSIPACELILSEFKNLNFDKVSFENEKVVFNKSLSINNVSYSYPSSEKQSIRNISLEINKGDKVGIIGKSGSGKSTLIDIIVGLLIPDQGSVEIDEKNIKKNIMGWQDKIAYVSQNIFLFDDTILNNIAIGEKNEDIDLKRIKEILKISKLDDFVNNLDNGIETIVGERGLRISGGEKQRIGLARALYKDSEIIVFDEATNSLDVHTEEEFMNDINNLGDSKTVIIVAHRLTIIKNCDKVHLVNNGEILKSGNFSTIIDSFNRL
tara:strand:- start:12457 stop:14214 length:1758 start_codon:yes stop_codon:yes gene_type:complete